MIYYSQLYSMAARCIVGRIEVGVYMLDGGLYLEYGYVELVNSDFMGKLCVYYA